MLEEEAASGRGRVLPTGLAALASFGLVACSLTFSPGDLAQGERPAGGGGDGGGGREGGGAGAPLLAGAAGQTGKGAAGALTAGGLGQAGAGGEVGGAPCGDNRLDPGEECDEGELNGPAAACSEGCTVRCEPGLFSGEAITAQDPTTKHCYALLTKVVTFDDAARECEATPFAPGVRLASVLTRAELDFVRGSLPLTQSTWLGLRDLDPNKAAVWDWVDGSPRGFLDPESAFWGASEPDDKGLTQGTEDGEEECVVLSNLYEFLLADGKCNREQPYVCEYSPTRPRTATAPSAPF
jgi:Lectin C-type domain